MRYIGIYVRTAVKDRKGVQAQKNELKGYVHLRNEKQPGWGKIREVYCDSGESGMKVDRPAFQRMLGDLRYGKIDTVLVCDLPRLTRCFATLCHFWRHLTEQGRQLIVLNESFDSTTASPETVAQMLFHVAESARNMSA